MDKNNGKEADRLLKDWVVGFDPAIQKADRAVMIKALTEQGSSRILEVVDLSLHVWVRLTPWYNPLSWVWAKGVRQTRKLLGLGPKVLPRVPKHVTIWRCHRCGRIATGLLRPAQGGCLGK